MTAVLDFGPGTGADFERAGAAAADVEVISFSTSPIGSRGVLLEKLPGKPGGMMRWIAVV